MEQNLKVAAYVRVSSAFERQQSSFENQISIYNSLIKKHPGWQLAGIYADEACSGTTEKRPAFQRLIRDCQQKKINLVLVKSISRFARNTLIAIQNVRKLQSLGIPVLFEKENIDTSRPYSEMLLTILAAFAQEESRNISERMKKGLQMRAQNGMARWIRTYGYRKGPEGKPVPEPTEAKVVQAIFQSYEHGDSLEQICAGLNERAVPSATGKQWSVTAVRDILCNIRYTGDVLTNKYYTQDHLTHLVKRNHGEVERILVANHHKALIDQDTFERVQVIRELKNRERGKTVQYPFGDRVRCPYCGKPMLQRKSFVSHNGSLWTCENESCRGFYFRSQLLEQTVLQALKEQLKNQAETNLFFKQNCKAATYANIISVEYWWVDELIRYITFGRHETEEDRTISIHWKNGTCTTLPSAVKKQDLPATLKDKEQEQERKKHADHTYPCQTKHRKTKRRRLLPGLHTGRRTAEQL